MSPRFLRLFDRLRRPGSQPTRRQLILNDDDYGQIEILPASEAAWCRHQFAAIETFAAQCQIAGGGGWSDLYRRPDPPRKIGDLGIRFAEADATIARLLPRFDEVIAGSGSVMKPVPRMRAFGPSPHAGIGLVADPASGTLAWIEVVLRESGPTAEAILAALTAIPSPEPLILVDWPRSRCLHLVLDGDALT